MTPRSKIEFEFPGGLLGVGNELPPEPGTPLPRHVPQTPPGLPEWPEIIPGMDAATFDAVIASGSKWAHPTK